MSGRRAKELRKRVYGDNSIYYKKTYTILSTGCWRVNGLRSIYQYEKGKNWFHGK